MNLELQTTKSHLVNRPKPPPCVSLLLCISKGFPTRPRNGPVMKDHSYYSDGVGDSEKLRKDNPYQTSG